MTIQRLEVSGLRNLRRVRLEDCGRINMISGANGSGKTSLLEAIYLLGMGRSFRSSKISPLIHHEMERAVVFADVLGGDGHKHTLGLSRSRDGTQQTRIDRRPVTSLVELARELPLQTLDSDSFSLIDGGPKVRRQFMDWGVFHVKPTFMEGWRRAQRALKQRNSLLRHGRGRMPDPQKGEQREILSLEAWERELAQSAEQIDVLRREYMDILMPHLLKMLACFTHVPDFSLEYKRGWRAETSLEELLRASRPRDAEQGFTQMGPHRANLEMRVGGLPAAEVLSRGQQKLVVASLKLAQGACLAEVRGLQGVYLVDDLPAELDGEHRRTLCRLLDDLGAQVFITSVDADVVSGAFMGSDWTQRGDLKRFHVEQGEYRCLTV